MEQKDNLIEVLRTLFRWKKQIITVCLITGIGAVAISLFLPNYYKGTTVFLAVSPDQAKPDALFGDGQTKTAYYGNENDIDRILTIAQSGMLINFLVDTFQLYEHYEINPDQPKAQFKVRDKFLGMYEVEKTKRDAIELSVEDKDRELAAVISNTARRRISEMARQLIRDGQQRTIQSYQSNIENKEAQLRSLSDSLITKRRRYGIYNIDGQSEALTGQVSEAESKLIQNRARLKALEETPGVPRDTIVQIRASVRGLEESFENLTQRMDRFNDGMAEVGTLNRQYLEANATLSEDKERLKQTLSVYNSNIPSVVVVEEAETPLIKSRPKRSLIVMAAVAIAFLFSVIGVLILDTYRDVDWKSIYKGV
ncbi:MAG: Wzz/FepE/Etk N-terminal domain-containing protein [Phaeodactylibacter sp.]|uniref:Wzz/FepE/Etk N-terminal domain-containing protein n=1 Tax=Phaeodactylibacter sp. TaxID=1940289 RepID=UPI0032EC57E3